MEADSSIELGPSAPALEVPWLDPDGQLAYVDLRSDPELLEENIDAIPEARQFPALRRFLLLTNSPQSSWQTAKCDVWSDASEDGLSSFAQSCYVDLFLNEKFATLRDSLEFHKRASDEIARCMNGAELLPASAEIVVRRCYFHRGSTPEEMSESDDGYCLTLFITGYSDSAAEAAEHWDQALSVAAEVVMKVKVE